MQAPTVKRVHHASVIIGPTGPQRSQLRQHIPSRQADIGQPVENGLDAALVVTRVRLQQTYPQEQVNGAELTRN
jgi:hypothetical protein